LTGSGYDYAFDGYPFYEIPLITVSIGDNFPFGDVGYSFISYPPFFGIDFGFDDY